MCRACPALLAQYTTLAATRWRNCSTKPTLRHKVWQRSASPQKRKNRGNPMRDSLHRTCVCCSAKAASQHAFCAKAPQHTPSERRVSGIAGHMRASSAATLQRVCARRSAGQLRSTPSAIASIAGAVHSEPTLVGRLACTLGSHAASCATRLQGPALGLLWDAQPLAGSAVHALRPQVSCQMHMSAASASTAASAVYVYATQHPSEVVYKAAPGRLCGSACSDWRRQRAGLSLGFRHPVALPMLCRCSCCCCCMPGSAPGAVTSARRAWRLNRLPLMKCAAATRRRL